MTRALAILAVLAAAGCASIPPASNCWEYGVEPNQPHWPGCKTVEAVALPKKQVWERCHEWGCARLVPDGHCTVYYYEKSRYVLNHELCHIEHGPRHVQPIHWRELLGRF